MDKDGVKTYCWDGEYISLNDSKLVYFREERTYSKDLDTGNEKEIYTSEMPVGGNYIGTYKNNEYYEVDGKIIFYNNQSNTNEEGQLPFENVGTAVISNEWIYMTCQAGFIKYNIETQLKITIAAHLATGQELFVCNNHIYYIDEQAFGINQVDLSDSSRKQIFRGNIYLDNWYI